MKTITFLADSLDNLSNFPAGAKHNIGFALHQVQVGNMPCDFKPMPSVGSGVTEIRARDENGIYRVLYVAKFSETIYVLHAFQKKTQKTAKPDIELAKTRYQQLIKELKS